MKKYTLDTSVLDLDENALFNFGGNEIILPSIVWEELNFQKEQGYKGYLPRKVMRLLRDLSKIRPLVEGVYLNEITEESQFYEKAKDLKTKIRISYQIKNDDINTKLLFNDNDYYVLACAKNEEAILVTADIAMYSIARDFGITPEEYRASEVNTKKHYKGYKVVKVRPHIIENLYRRDFIEDEWELFPNEFIIFENQENENHRAIGIKKRVKGHMVVKKVDFEKDLNLTNTKAIPANLEQKMLLYLLQDPSITCVTITGVSGKGKTLLSIEYALNQIADSSNNKYKFMYTKSIKAVDEDEELGFYKGDVVDKLKPHLKPLYSAFEFLFKKELYTSRLEFMNKERRQKVKNNGKGEENHQKSNDKAYSNDGEKEKPLTLDGLIDKFIESDRLEIFPLANIRGMSANEKIVMLDEAQNTKKHMIKSLVTRINDTSKLIVTGDIEQIDDKNLNQFNNGLVHLIENGKEEEFIAHITLDINPTSKRGKLADFGASKL